MTRCGAYRVARPSDRDTHRKHAKPSTGEERDPTPCFSIADDRLHHHADEENGERSPEGSDDRGAVLRGFLA